MGNRQKDIMANSAKSSPMVWTTRCVRILRDLRRFAPTGVFVITGVSEFAVNIRRRPDGVAALLVSPRRREANFQNPRSIHIYEERRVATTISYARTFLFSSHYWSTFGPFKEKKSCFPCYFFSSLS